MNLSAIKNNPVASIGLINMAIAAAIKVNPNKDIHRVLVYTDRVELTLVDKESMVAFFWDYNYSLAIGLEIVNAGYRSQAYHTK